MEPSFARRIGTAVVAAVVAAGCAGVDGTPRASTARATPASARISPSPTASLVPLSQRTVIRIRVGDRVLRVAVADDEAAREQGLMAVTDLGGLDGMLFRFHATVTRTFWMKDTLVPLDIAFFDAAGRFVSATTMPLCRVDPCPTYVAAGPYEDALEARQGSLGFLRAGDTLTIVAAPS